MERRSINRVELQGRIGTVRIMSVGDSLVANFSIMTEYQYATSEGVQVVEASWFNAVAFEKTGISLEGLTRGASVHLEGRLRNTRYTDASGCEKFFTEVVVNTLDVIQ